MGARLETSIESNVCEWIECHVDWYAVKLLKRIGWPDRLILGPGPTIYFIEFKRLGETPDQIQLYVHKLLRKLGLKVYVCENEEDGKEIFRGHF